MTRLKLSFALPLLIACSSAPQLPKAAAPASASAAAPAPVAPEAPPPDVVDLEIRGGHVLGTVIEDSGFMLTVYKPLCDPTTGALPEAMRAVVWQQGVRSERTAHVVAIEPTLNLAILELDGESTLRASPMLREAGLAVGQAVSATFMDGERLRTVDGTISGLRAKECYQESLTSTMMRVVIALPKGAVGAPIRAASGEVIALYTGYDEPSQTEPAAEGAEHVALQPGETYVMPIDLPLNIYEGIKQRRSMRSPWTGFSVRPLTEAERAYFPTDRRHQGGVGIEYVWKGSPAEKMGVRVDDILVQFSHFNVTSPAEFQGYLYTYGVGPTVELVFLRGSREYLAASYTIEERPSWAKPK